jgi:hypothetical protein
MIILTQIKYFNVALVGPLTMMVALFYPKWSQCYLVYSTTPKCMTTFNVFAYFWHENFAAKHKHSSKWTSRTVTFCPTMAQSNKCHAGMSTFFLEVSDLTYVSYDLSRIKLPSCFFFLEKFNCIRLCNYHQEVPTNNYHKR